MRLSQNFFSLRSLLLVYTLCALTTATVWHKTHKNGLTGDEPHYLIMANGLLQHGALEQSIPYADALGPGQAQRYGLSPEMKPGPAVMHTVAGPHGQFNVHNFGLPVLLTLPFAIGGKVGAKLFMLLCGSLIVICAWKMSGLFVNDRRQRWLAVCATCIGMPLIPAANQVYPDLLAGAIAMLGLYWFSSTQKQRSPGREALFAAAVAYMPWLQIKFGVACAALLLSVAAKVFAESRDARRVLRLFAVAGVSCLTLLAYNSYAFGKLSGPYIQDALVLNPTSLMVLQGLLIDQNQGLFLQNPVYLIGLLGTGWLYRTRRSLALLGAFLFLLLLVLNALHPNWYGGWSFSGRFGWTAVVVFMVPTLYGLLELARRREQAFFVVVALAMLLQAYLFYRYTFAIDGLYNRGPLTPFDVYALFYPTFHTWLPAFYNVAWAYGHAPNYAWLTLIALLTVAGFVRLQLKRLALLAAALYAALYGGGAAVLAATSSPLTPRADAVFPAAELPARIGRIEGSARSADPSRDAPGFINYGPYLPYARSHYRVTIRYSSAGDENETTALFDVYDKGLMQPLAAQELRGTQNALREVSVDFDVKYLRKEALLEFRNLWLGRQSFKVYDISVKAL